MNYTTIFLCILPIAIIFIIVGSILSITKTIEYFEDAKKDTPEENLKRLYMSFAEILCPCLTDVLTEIGKDPDNQPIEKYIQKRAMGSLMECPMATDMLTLSPDIGEKILRTVKFLNKELDYVYGKIQASLQESCKYIDKFEDLGIQESQESQESEEKTSKIPEELKQQIYQQRFTSILSAVSSSPNIGTQMGKIKSMYAKIKDIQQNPERIKSAC